MKHLLGTDYLKMFDYRSDSKDFLMRKPDVENDKRTNTVTTSFS